LVSSPPSVYHHYFLALPPPLSDRSISRKNPASYPADDSLFQD
jgi:hypothetical protein